MSSPGLHSLERIDSSPNNLTFTTKIQSTLCNSNSLEDGNNVRSAKSSKYRDSNYTSFLLANFKGPENFFRISKSSNYTSSNQTALTVFPALLA